MEYIKSGTFKNVNCGYAIVDGIIFSSIRQAEYYCNKNNISLTHVKSCSEESFNKSKEIARNLIPNLKRIIADINSAFENTREAEILRKQEEVDILSEKKKDVLEQVQMEVLQDQIKEGKGKLEGYSRVLDYLYKVLRETESIAYKKSAGIE